jgi:hypothetical protein
MSTSPGSRGLPYRVPELLAQVRLISESALQGNVAQRGIGGQHVFRGKRHTAPHDK